MLAAVILAGVSLAHTRKSAPLGRLAELIATSPIMSEDPGVSRSEIFCRISSEISIRSRAAAESSPCRLIAIHRVFVSPGANFMAVKRCVPSGVSGSRKFTGASKTLPNSCLTNRCPAGG
jgi:hypothetical protein